MILIEALAAVINTLLYVYSFLIIGRAIISWVSPDPYNPIVNFLYTVTEPVMKHARRIIPPIGGTIDISPIVVLVLIYLLRITITRFLFDLSRGL